MVYSRMVSEALATARAAMLSCGAIDVLAKAVEIMERFIGGRAVEEELEDAVILLLEAAEEAKARGCLDWYRVEEAARILEQALG